MFEPEVLKQKIESALPGAQVEVKNPRKDGEHFMAKVVYSGFEGRTLIEQHKMVYKALEEEFGAGMHSLSLKTEVLKDG